MGRVRYRWIEALAELPPHTARLRTSERGNGYVKMLLEGSRLYRLCWLLKELSRRVRRKITESNPRDHQTGWRRVTLR